MADKGDRVTNGFDSGRFGDPVAADKGGRVTGSAAAEKGGRVTNDAPDSARFGGGSSTGRQPSSGGGFANGGTNSDRASASSRSAAGAAIGNGLGVSAGLTPPSVSARSAEARSMNTLAAVGAPPAGSARAAETASMNALGASRAAPAGSSRAAEGASMSALARSVPTPLAERGGRVTAIDPARFGEPVSQLAEKGSRVTNRSSSRDAEDASMSKLAASRTPAAGSPRRAEDSSLTALHSYDREVVGVPSAGKGWTQVERRDGTIETREGMRSSRNNNPGNLEYGDFARSKGAIGSDGRFAVFATPEQGRAAMEGLVFGPSYAERTIADAIGRYAPAHENNSAKYASTIAAAAGVPTSARVGSLEPAQRTAMIEAMTRVEGNRPHSTTTQVQGSPRGVPPGAARATTDRIERTYLAEAPKPTARPEAREDRGRLPGLAGIAPSHMPANAIASFDRSKLSADLNPILDGIAAVRPDAQIRSGYRDPERNARVGGARQSQHMQGRAVDIDMRGWSDEERRAVLDAAIASGARGIGIYNGGTSLHVDARPTGRAMWGGNPSGAYNGMSLAQAPEWSRASLAAWQGAPETGSRRAAEAAVVAQNVPPALPAARMIADRPVATPTTRAVERIETVYLGGSATPTARSDTAQAKPERTMSDRILAGAIDVGVGMIPGLGTAAGIYGLAAPMIGLPTVGDMVLSMRDRNEVGSVRQTSASSRDGGENADERMLRRPIAETDADTLPVTPVATSFAAKYLGFVDTDATVRPTPMEKWGAAGAPIPGRYAL